MTETRNDTTGQLRLHVGKLIFETFQNIASQWHWHVKARNGKIVATSGEGFDDKFNAERAMRGFIGRLGL